MPSPALMAPVATGPSYWLRRTRVPVCLIDGPSPPADGDGLACVDLHVVDGRVAAIETPATRAGRSVDLDLGMVWPGFVDMHTHLDKGHIWPRRANRDGTFASALEAARDDRARHWTAEDVRRRMEFGLAAAYAHGTTAIRTHLDSMAPQDGVTWDVFDEVRERWAGRIALQGVSLIGIDEAGDSAFLARLADRVAKSGGVLGAVAYMVPCLEALLRDVFAAAAARGLDLDFHADETLDPSARALELIARTALDTGFSGRIVCGHCCSLSALAEDKAGAVLDLVAEAGIAVVSLPMCNLYLQDRRPGETPRRRGITLIRELAARGVAVAVASDNTRDPFFAYGDLDPLEVLREAVRIGHLDHPIDAAPALVTRAPADIIGLAGHGRIAPGAMADLVLFDGRSYTELLARPESGRVVLRAGRPVERRLPDYRELDDLVGAA